MRDRVPTCNAEGPTSEDDEHYVVVHLPADVADELMIATVWLSLRLGHQLPLAALRRALVLGGVANAHRVLADLQGRRARRGLIRGFIHRGPDRFALDWSTSLSSSGDGDDRARTWLRRC